MQLPPGLEADSLVSIILTQSRHGGSHGASDVSLRVVNTSFSTATPPYPLSRLEYHYGVKLLFGLL